MAKRRGKAVQPRSRTSPWVVILVLLACAPVLVGVGMAIVPILKKARETQEQKQEGRTRQDEANEAAQAPIVDEARGFTVKWPDRSDVTLTRGEEAESFFLGATAGLVTAKGCWVGVGVERVPDVPLKALARFAAGEEGEAKLEDKEAFDRKGVLLALPLQPGRAPPTQEAAFFAREGEHVYTISLRFLESFGLLPCLDLAEAAIAIRGGDLRLPPLPDRAGPQRSFARIEKGVLESPPYRLRIQRPPGMRFVAGGDVATARALATLQGPGVQAAVRSVRLSPKGGLRAALDGELNHAGMEIDEDEKPEQFKSDGRDVLQVREEDPDAGVVRFVAGFADAEFAVFVRGRFPLAMNAVATENVRHVLHAIELLGEAAAAQLAPLPQVDVVPQISQSAALRGGRYTHFDKGIRFVVPPGPSMDMISPETGTDRPILGSYRDDLGVTLLLQLAEGTDVTHAQEAIVRPWVAGGGRLQPVRVRPSGAAHRVVDYPAEGGYDARVDVRTLGKGDVVVHLIALGAKVHLERQAALLDAAELSLQLEQAPIAKTSVFCPKLQNAHVGVTLDLPGGGWTCSRTTGDVVVTLEGRRGDEKVFLYALPTVGQDAEFGAAMIEREILRKLPANAGRVDRKVLFLRPGVTATRLSFTGGEMAVVRGPSALVLVEQYKVANPRAIYDQLVFD